MVYFSKFKMVVAVCILVVSIPATSQTPGYYKDIFSDGGVHLTHDTYLDAAENLGLSVEYLCVSDTSVQNGVMIGTSEDSNGHLLYPDGQPRFRMIYTNGGQSTNHGYSLGEVGRERVRAFYNNGGSYSGSCAGAYLACIHYNPTGTNTAYYHIWPGRTESTGLADAYTGHNITSHSPLLAYFDFGNDLYVDNVRHNGGCWANEEIDVPPRTEILLRYHTPTRPAMNGKASTWAWKPDRTHGRVVVTGSHPEIASSGEVLNLMQAILLYALDGVGSPQLKAGLVNGETRIMDQSTEDTIPEFTRIGDRQYHHFSIDIPEGEQQLLIELEAETGFDFNLYANPGSFAFENEAQFVSTSEGEMHTLDITTQTSGTWYIGVECATTVDDFYYMYSGLTEVLNGVAYHITATWDTVEVVGVAELAGSPPGFEMYPNYPNPFNPSTTIRYELSEQTSVALEVYDVSGGLVASLVNEDQAAGKYQVQWSGTDNYGGRVNAGLYFCRIRAGEYSKSMKMILLQ